MSGKAGKSIVYLCGLLLLLVNACNAVKITSVTEPQVYELKEGAGELRLDCDFSIGADERGFVLKWLLNSVPIYQWIPSSKVPYALNAFKGRIDVETSNSEDRYKKHSALVIPKPYKNESGTYTCNIQTYESSDKMSTEILIIDPANSVEFTYLIDQEEETVDLECTVKHIYPLPTVQLLFVDDTRNSTTMVTDNEDGTFDIVMSAHIKKSDIQDESEVTCLVKIPKSDYEIKKTINYDDPKQSATTKKSILGELTKYAHSDAGDTNENHGHGLRCSLMVLILSAVAVLLSPSH